jgi:hypothetical protein
MNTGDCENIFGSFVHVFKVSLKSLVLSVFCCTVWPLGASSKKGKTTNVPILRNLPVFGQGPPRSRHART